MDNGGEAIAVGADVSRAADVARLFKEVHSAFGRSPKGLIGLLHGENRPENVDVVMEVKALFGDLREGAETEYSGVVDKNG